MCGVVPSGAVLCYAVWDGIMCYCKAMLQHTPYILISAVGAFILWLGFQKAKNMAYLHFELALGVHITS